MVPSGILSASDDEPGEPQQEQDRRDEEQKMRGEAKSDKEHNKQQDQQNDHLSDPLSLAIPQGEISRSSLKWCAARRPTARVDSPYEEKA